MPGRRGNSTPAPPMDNRLRGMIAANMAHVYLQQSTGGNAGNRAPSVKTEFKMVDIFSGSDSTNEHKFHEVHNYMGITFVDNAASGRKESLISEGDDRAFKKALQYKNVLEQCLIILGPDLANLVLDTTVQFKLPDDGSLDFVKRIKKLLTQVNKGLKHKRDHSGVLPPLVPTVPPAAPSPPPAASFNGEDAIGKVMRFLEEERAARMRAEERIQQLEQERASVQNPSRARSPSRPGSSSNSTAAPRSRTFVSNAASVLQGARYEADNGYDLPRSASMGRTMAWESRSATPASWEERSG